MTEEKKAAVALADWAIELAASDFDTVAWGEEADPRISDRAMVYIAAMQTVRSVTDD